MGGVRVRVGVRGGGGGRSEVRHLVVMVKVGVMGE